jgi:hypothetical protein
MREFKVGDRVKHPAGNTGVVVAAKDWPWDVALPDGQTPVRWDNDGDIRSSGMITLLARVPLSAVKTAAEAEQWLGEEVEVWHIDKEEWKRDKISGFHERDGKIVLESQDWGYVGPNVYDGGWAIRPLSGEEPVTITPGDGEAASAEGSGIHIETQTQQEEPDDHCQHCGAHGLEAHKHSCPNNPFGDKLSEGLRRAADRHNPVFKAARKRESFLDELRAIPRGNRDEDYVSIQELAREGRRIGREMTRK